MAHRQTHRKGIILAGGAGTRLHPATAAMSTQLLPPCGLILGDNVFHGSDLAQKFNRANAHTHGARRFACRVKNSERIGGAGLETGNHEALLLASNIVEAIEKRQGLKIACAEEIAHRIGSIDASQRAALAEPLSKSDYGKYLADILREQRGQSA